MISVRSCHNFLRRVLFALLWRVKLHEIMSVIFPAILLGLNHIASAVIKTGERLIGRNDSFELSNDGESVFGVDGCYRYVGFCDGGVIPDHIGSASPGRVIGSIIDDALLRVWELETEQGDYIMVGSSSDCADIYRLAV